MTRYFKCINHNTAWSEYFAVGEIYEHVETRTDHKGEDTIRLRTNDGAILWVDPSSFEEIVVNVIIADEDSTVSFGSGGIVISDIPHDKITRKERRIKFLTDRLSKPDLEVEEMNKLLDELNSLK